MLPPVDIVSALMLDSTAASQHCVVLKMKCMVLCYTLEPPVLNLQGWGQLQWTPFRKCQRCMGSLGLDDDCAVPGYWFRVLVSSGRGNKSFSFLYMSAAVPAVAARTVKRCVCVGSLEALSSHCSHTRHCGLSFQSGLPQLSCMCVPAYVFAGH